MLNPSNAASADPHLCVTALSCQRGERRLLENINFTVKPQQLLHIVGANGSGKTSLLRILAGLSTPEDGAITWNNDNIKNSLSFADDLAYIGHRDGIKNSQTALENLKFYQQLSHPLDHTALENTLHKLDLLPHIDQLAGQLSFGQRRRLAFARLLINDCRLWLLDEPFTGIDIAGRTLIENLCIKHLEDKGMIIITHHGSLSDSPLAQFKHELNLDTCVARGQ